MTGSALPHAQSWRRFIPWRKLSMVTLLLTCVGLASGSLWLVERGVQDLDDRLELRRQALWGFESLRQRVVRFRNRRHDELAAEREEIEIAYALVAEDWQRERPIGGLDPMLRESANDLELVFVPVENGSDGDRSK